MAKKKNEEVKQGLAEWMGTFSDMMTIFSFHNLIYLSSRWIRNFLP